DAAHARRLHAHVGPDDPRWLDAQLLRRRNVRVDATVDDEILVALELSPDDDTRTDGGGRGGSVLSHAHLFQHEHTVYRRARTSSSVLGRGGANLDERHRQLRAGVSRRLAQGRQGDTVQPQALQPIDRTADQPARKSYNGVLSLLTE